MPSVKPHHICVVGAGISGLRCAGVLLENGFQVTIIEARDRIGGRICQSDKLGYRVDIGPNWIHTSGQGRHPILDLAKKTNTPLHHWNDKQLIFDSSGKPIPEEKADKLSSLLWKYIAEAFTHSAENEKQIPETDSLYDFIKSRAVEALSDEKEDLELLLQMSQMWGAYIGAPVTRQSLKFAWMEECCGGDDEMFVEKTWEAILAEIAKLPLEKAEIRLGEKVTGVQTSDREEGGKVAVTTDKGQHLSFDEVVMTTPLGWLKRNLDVFQPPLPERLLAGINRMSVGNLEKVYITFPTAFWLDPSSNGADTFPAYTNWLSPTYTSTTNPQQWPVEMWNLASFAPANRHATMIFYLYGECSSHLVSLVQATNSTSDTSAHEILNTFFRPYYSLLPNFSASRSACTPLAILSTAWQHDPLAGHGSYCNVQTGATDAKTWVEDMRHGAPERKLWFCGEHCSPFEELGTVAGAYLSGEGVAARIVGIGSGESRK